MFGNNFKDLKSYKAVCRTEKPIITHIASLLRINELMLVNRVHFRKVCTKYNMHNFHKKL